MMLGVILWIQFGLIGFLIGYQVIKNSEYRYLLESKEDRRSFLLSSSILGPLFLVLTLTLLILMELSGE